MEDTFRSQFRLPYPLYEKLKAVAEQSNRSLNAEIVARLQSSFQRDESEEREFQAWREVTRLERQVTQSPSDTSASLQQALSEHMERIESMMAKRDDRLREWWIKEFGYDPQAPQIKRAANKGPTRSANAPKPPPK